MTTETIEVDAVTAAALKARAVERGISVSDLLAEMAAQAATVVLSSDELAELDRLWDGVKAGEATVAHEDVARWLETWGTPAFKPWA